MSTPPRIGDILVAHGAIEREALEAHVPHAHDQLGASLHAHGMITPRQLSHAIATQQQLAWVDLLAQPPDRRLFRPHELVLYQARRYVPYAQSPDLLVIATCAPTEALRQWAQRHYGQPVRLVVTGSRDLAHYYDAIAATAATRTARLKLRRRMPGLIADRVLLPSQRYGVCILLATIGGLATIFPATCWQMLLVGCNLFYLATLGVKWQLYTHGAAAQRQQARESALLDAAVTALPLASLPVYTVLVPLYQEDGAVMQRLITNLLALDYPREKLDIKLIVEADDHATIAALKTLRPPALMEIVTVPPSLPRTKPKACNVALPRIRGEYAVIFDAEDAPAPDQLKRAVALFAQSSPQVACLQASLNYYNRDENLLTQLFSIEYSALFTILLPALARLSLPVPLGGTSNHLRVSLLQAVGGWDPFNVTEDADLGIRLSYLGYRTRILPSLTLEEAPISFGAWVKQRTRWIKGYIHTWLVYMRNAPELKRRLGAPGYYGFQFFVGAPALTFLLAPLFWGIFLASLTGWLPMHLSLLTGALCALSFAGGVASHWIFARAVLKHEGWQHLQRAAWLYPFYWLLHSAAAARALWQLAFQPHRWEKTRHGVSRWLKTAT